MKLSLVAYGMFGGLTLPELIRLARDGGFAGLDVRCEYGLAHGVEVTMTDAERRQARHRIEDAFLELVCVRSGARFESPDLAERRRNVDSAMRHVDLAADLGAPFVRVSGHNIPEGHDRDRVVDQVGEGLAEIADYAAGTGCTVLLEMLGDFRNWHFALRALRQADRPGLGVLYNSENVDVVGGSVSAALERLRPWLRHVDVHDLTSGYPYRELVDVLTRWGYDGYYCAEPPLLEPEREGYARLYGALLQAYGVEARLRGASTSA
ncbi:MAG: sugar phosphate isomerase/epimerase family protein [Protaetiibacter sp.]